MKSLKLKNLLVACIGVIGIFLSISAAQAGHDRIRIDVWADHGFDDPYWSEDAFELFIRPDENCYVTIMVIDPDGYANVIYPLNRHQQRRLYRNRVYRLSDLLDEPLYFYGLDGRAHISVVATSRPAFLNPWLLDEVYAFAHRPYSLNAFGVRISLGPVEFESRFGFYWTNHVRSYGYSVFTTPILIRPAIRYQKRYVPRPAHHHQVWQSRWEYRSKKPVFVHRKAEHKPRIEARADRRSWDRRDRDAREPVRRSDERTTARKEQRRSDRVVQPETRRNEQPRSPLERKNDQSVQKSRERGKSSDAKKNDAAEESRKPSRRTKKQ